MRLGKLRISPAMVVAALALFLALGGSVYAARKARVNGRVIKPGTIPGNRLQPRSVPANRLRPRSIPPNRLRRGVLRGIRINKPLTGAEINELTLGQVPNAARADRAETARRATDAGTARNAEEADRARTVNGYGAGCLADTRSFAGACWERSASPALPAKQAARRCARRGGSLPAALELAAFAEEHDVRLHANGEWSGEIFIPSGPDIFSMAKVSQRGKIDHRSMDDPLAYRCVIPLLK